MKFLLNSTLLVAALFIPFTAQANLTFIVDTSNFKVDWLDGGSITKSGGIENNRFGSGGTSDLRISDPLLTYSGGGAHIGVGFGLSNNAIDGIGLLTDFPPGNQVTFAASVEEAIYPTIISGDVDGLFDLDLGSYFLAPVDSAWTGGVMVQVIPESQSYSLILAILAVFMISCYRGRSRR